MRLLTKVLRVSMVFALILTTMLISNTSQVSAASSGSFDQWSIRSPFATQNLIQSTCYGNSTFVTVGDNGTILTSPDGVIWTPQTSGTTNNLNGVSYGNSTFVTAGDSGTILTSPDGVTWTPQTSDSTIYLGGISYSNSTFVVVGGSGTVLTSPDGETWTPRTSGTTSSLLGVSCGNSTFVAVGYDGVILTSPDGETWTPQTSAFGSLLYGVSYGNSTFVVVEYYGHILTSPDGVTWTRQNDAITNILNGVSYGNSTFVAVGSGGTVLTSPDGVDWTPQTSGITDSLYGVSYDNSTFVAVGVNGKILTSPDGVTWTSAGTTTDLSGVSYGNSTFVAVGYGGVILTSPDEVTWTPQVSGTTNDLYGVSYGNSTFVVVGKSGTILTSTDGVTWIPQTSGTTNLLLGVSCGNGTFVAVGDSGIVLTSSNGETWTCQDYSMSNLNGVIYGNSTFVAVGPFGHIRTSTDGGETWILQNLQTNGIKNYLGGVSYGNSTFVVVGASGTVLTSSDGETWIRQTSGLTEHQSLRGVSYGNSAFVAVGESGIILTSPDGVTWTSKTSNLTSHLNGVTYANGTFVAVGNGGYIIQSGTFTTYAVTVNSGTASPSTAGENTTVTITANTALSGKQFKEWTVESGGVTLASTTSAATTFIMPANSVEITATYEDIPVCSTVTVNNGTASPSTAAENTTVSITANTAPDGKQFKEWTVESGGVTLASTTSAATTFTMPANAVEITATYEDLPASTYAITIQNNGNGTANANVNAATHGTEVILTATPDNACRFIEWQVVSGGVTITDNKFTMPAANVILRAIFEAISTETYTVTFNLNGGTRTGGSELTQSVDNGGSATAPTATRSGYTFAGWNIAFSNVTCDLTVTAQWNSNGGSTDSTPGSSTGGTTGSSPTTPAPTVSGSTATTMATTKTGSDGTVSASVSETQVKGAVKAAQEAAKSTGEAPKVEIHIEGDSGASGVETTLPQSAVQALVTGEMESLKLSSAVANITFDAQTIAAIADTASGDVLFTASNVENSTLSDAARQLVGGRPVYNFSVTSGNKTISQFNGTVTVSLPYTPAKGEDTNAIVAYYINADGEPELMQNCYYDAEAGALVFTTDHFSTYAVGYNKVAFNDVSDDAWFSDAVSYLAARGITGGTSETTFSPEATLTRGQLITLLMRAYGITPDEASADNFTDAGSTYYTGYLAVAKRLEISNGIGDNKFAPEQAITRQEMFTLLYNALKAIDQLSVGEKLSDENSGKNLSDFTDSASTSSYAQEAMAYMVETGVTSGSNGQLNATDTTTRAQMAQVLYNLLSK